MMAVLMPTTSPRDGHQRAAGIARVERRVGLHDVVDQPAGLGAQRAAERAHHAGGDRGLETVGVADGHRDLAGADRLRIAQLGRGEIRSVDAHDREVRMRVVADNRGSDPPAIAQRDLDLARATNDVAIGQREAIGREDEARAAAAAAIGSRTAPRVGLGWKLNVDFDDRRGDPLDGAGHDA